MRISDNQSFELQLSSIELTICYIYAAVESMVTIFCNNILWCFVGMDVFMKVDNHVVDTQS
jgi:hypothetical protein